VHPAPACCPCCGGTKLSKIGEDVTETLDVCRGSCSSPSMCGESQLPSCEKISAAAAPFHAISRASPARALLAMILATNTPIISRSTGRASNWRAEGVELSVSTMADHVGASRRAVAACRIDQGSCVRRERIHGGMTPPSGAGQVKDQDGRLWTYVRDDRPFGGARSAAAVYFYSPDRGGAASRAASR